MSPEARFVIAVAFITVALVITGLVLKFRLDALHRRLTQEKRGTAVEAERERRRLDLAARLERARSAQKRVRSPSKPARQGKLQQSPKTGS